MCVCVYVCENIYCALFFILVVGLLTWDSVINFTCNYYCLPSTWFFIRCFFVRMIVSMISLSKSSNLVMSISLVFIVFACKWFYMTFLFVCNDQLSKSSN